MPPPTQAVLGNGLQSDRSYSPQTGRLNAGKLTNAQTHAQQLLESYFYDALGNVTTRNQTWNDNNQPGFSENFAYDGLNRLSESTVLGQAKQVFTYDGIGNLTSKTGVGSYTYPAPGPGAVQPHAVSSIAGSGTNTSFSYDANGNLASGAGRSLTWTSFDMPQSIAKGSEQSLFVYGPEHQRTKQIKSGSVNSTIYYAGTMEVETTGANATTVKTYWPNGLGVEIDKPGATTSDLEWTHTDRLGSVIAISGPSGTLSEQLEYDAWGKRRTLPGDATPDTLVGQVDNKGYTGHEMLDQLGLVHMNGRVYDPLVARFMSADPLIQDPMHSQSYNRYTYVWNNPTNLTDPTGFSPEDNGMNYGNTGSNIACKTEAACIKQGLSTGVLRPTGTEDSGTKKDVNGINQESAKLAKTPGTQNKSTDSANSEKGFLSRVSDFFSGANRETNCGALGCIHQGTLEATPVRSHTGNSIKDVINDVNSEAAVTVVNAGMRVASWWKNLTILGLGGASEVGPAAASSGIWGGIRATQPVYEGTVIPRSFEMLAGGNQVWVHPNATEHMAEYAIGMLNRGVSPEAVALRSQAQLSSLQNAVGQAMAHGMPTRNAIINVGGWELQFSRNALDKLPVLKHALQH